MIKRCISILTILLLLAEIIPTFVSAVTLTNLALNKTATSGSGSFCGGGETATQAVDGNTSTKWCRNSGADWLKVDLGATYNVSEFILTNNEEISTYITKDYNIQSSTDGSTWTTLVNVTNNTTRVVTSNITPVMARYVKLDVISPTQNGSGVIRINEFEVNGDPVALVNAATPGFESQPTGSTVNEGDSSPTLSAAANVNDGGALSYQWYSNTTNSNSGGNAIGGATSASYAAPTNAEGTTYYYVVVTNTNNGVDGVSTAKATSNAVAVSVNALVNAATPSFDTQPTGSTVNEGDSSPTLSAAANVSDGGKLSYQWFSNTTNSNSGGNAIGGATSVSYAAPTNAEGTTYYYVVVTNTNNGVTGNQTATATSNAVAVSVNALVNAATPSFDTQPTGSTVNEGDSSPTLSAAASVSDGGALSYQWYSNTTNSNSGGNAIGGATSASYAAPTNAEGTTYYYLVVTNTNKGVNGVQTSTATSNVARLNVNQIAPSAPTNLTATIGDGQVTLHWNGVSGSVTYDVYEGTASGSYGSTPVAIVTGLTYNYKVTGLTNGITYYFVIKASNAAGYSSYSNELSATPRSSNANLSDLILSSGTLNMSFDANTASYATSVANSVSSLTVTATVYDPTATMKVNGTTVINGSAVGAISLNVGSNTITIVVTAQDGMTTQTYTVTVTRESDVFVTFAQTDASGQTVQLTFSQPLASQSIAPGAFLMHAGSKPIAVMQAVHDSSLSNTVYLTVNENLFKWDRLTVDIQGGIIQSANGSQLAGTASIKVQNEVVVFSPDFPDPNHIRIDNIVAFLKKRNYDVDVDGDGLFDSADIKMLLLQIQSVTH
ncbi:discoidin domain-containing protein [Paenibacillus agricola]|uniref:F5/8 type C domain-containing protein n=1 Tax=Paenibacillus agricola TaxID=2716264 RepID=A0ABX0J690_9BACL|nr:discoidin domain-containing protein [Paenibacillus agricola]NHN31865.1 hypothetical protein [Paenibacillus agricola]